MAAGNIYILINPALKDMVKIGKTERSPDERAGELSSTSTPYPFVVAYEHCVSDCDRAEREIHEALDHYRINPHREFFRLSVKEAIKRVAVVCDLLAPSDTAAGYGEDRCFFPICERDCERYCVNPATKTLERTFQPDRDVFFVEQTWEYKFDGNQLFVRLHDSHTASPEGESWFVRDGVVLESNIREQSASRMIKSQSVEEELADYSSQVQHWHPFLYQPVRFFVMGKHPELFQHKELRKLIRGELERVRVAVQRIVPEAKSLGVEIREDVEGFEFRHPDNWPKEEDEAKAEMVFSPESLRSLGTSVGELQTAKRIQHDLLTLLGKCET